MSNKKEVSEVLLQFVQGVRGLAWAKNRNGWDETSSDVCQWDGVGCSLDEPGTITTLNLESSDLVGTIPSDISKLTSLVHLLLSDNRLHGTIPDTLGVGMTNLVVVDLSSNNLRGALPHSWDSTVLQVLNLSGNQQQWQKRSIEL